MSFKITTNVADGFRNVCNSASEMCVSDTDGDNITPVDSNYIANSVGSTDIYWGPFQ